MSTDFRVYVVTWNVAGSLPPAEFRPLLCLDSQEKPDLYAIGLQELDTNSKHMVAESMHEDEWSEALTITLAKHNFVKVKSIRMVAIHLFIFVRRDKMYKYVTNVESEYTRRGYGHVGLKGGVTVRMDIGGLDVCFVCCHLTAHQDNVDDRIQDYSAVMESQSFRDETAKSILEHNYVIFMGDLNFRIDNISMEAIRDMIKRGDIASLFKYDQLKKYMTEEMLLVNFVEAPINFPPTYKFDPGTDNYDTSEKQRKPAWCDRILWMVEAHPEDGVELSVRPINYQSHPEYKQSDHKPVSGLYILKVPARPPLLPIQFENVGDWRTHKDAVIMYTCCLYRSLKLSTWDWIGIYKTNFKDPQDYESYVYASKKSLGDKSATCSNYRVRFKRKRLPKKNGRYILAYFSKAKNCLMGYSNEFEIFWLEKPVSGGSSSDSSEETDREKERGKEKSKTGAKQRRPSPRSNNYQEIK